LTDGLLKKANMAPNLLFGLFFATSKVWTVFLSRLYFLHESNGVSMKFWSVSAILAALLLTACGEKAEAPVEPAVAPEATAPAAEPAAPAAVEPGGYVPTPEEQVKGITRTQEELDKLYAEARANTPLPTIPGEAPAPAPAEPVAAEAPAAESK